MIRIKNSIEQFTQMEKILLSFYKMQPVNQKRNKIILNSTMNEVFLIMMIQSLITDLIKIVRI